MPLGLCSWTPPANPIQCAMEPSYVGNALQVLAKQWLTYVVFPKFKNLTSQNFWITPYTLSGPSTGCFPRRWTLLSARKLVSKKLKNIFSKMRYSHAHAHYFIVFIYLATWRAAKLGIFTHFFFKNLPWCSQSMNSLICILCTDPQLLFMSAWSQSLSHFFVLPPPKIILCITRWNHENNVRLSPQWPCATHALVHMMYGYTLLVPKSTQQAPFVVYTFKLLHFTLPIFFLFWPLLVL